MDPAALEPALPRTLGEFRIVSVLGEGGSGIVYDATWGPRRVALKVLHPNLANDERVRVQFLAEAQRLQQITHSSVVKVLNVGLLPDGRPFLAMERLDGETLSTLLARGALPLEPALELFAELCAAVGALHDQGLVHRDLKPENVFIVDSKHAVLLDFGIAKDLAAAASTTTMEGGVRGTPAYMAPERFFGQPAAIATDIYELAVTLYAMLAGRLPWDDLADPEARLSPRPLVEFAEVPEELDVEIRRALSTRAQNRPASASALLAAIRIAAGGTTPAASETARMRPQSTPPPVTGERAPTVTAERKPWFAERHATTDRGKTPLAWAPTAQAPPAPSPTPPRSRKRLWLAGAAAVALAGGIVAWRLAREDDAAPTKTPVVQQQPPDAPKVDDPWDRAPRVVATPPPEIEVSGDDVPLATAQREAAAAIGYLPADTTVVIGGQIGALRRDSRFREIFDLISKLPQAQMLTTSLPDCVKAMLGKAEWFVMGSPGFTGEDQGTLIFRGRWTRDSVMQCFALTSEERTMTDGKLLLELPEVGWVDFVDEHTVYVSVRQELTAAQVHANVVHPKGPTLRTRTLLGKLPANRMFTLAVDGANKLRWPQDTLPAGTDATAWFLPTEPGIAFEVLLDTKAEASAATLATKLQADVGAVFASASANVGNVKITRDKTRVRMGGDVSNLIVSLATSALKTP